MHVQGTFLINASVQCRHIYPLVDVQVETKQGCHLQG